MCSHRSSVNRIVVISAPQREDQLIPEGVFVEQVGADLPFIPFARRLRGEFFPFLPAIIDTDNQLVILPESIAVFQHRPVSVILVMPGIGTPEPVMAVIFIELERSVPIIEISLKGQVSGRPFIIVTVIGGGIDYTSRLFLLAVKVFSGQDRSDVFG